MATKWLIVTFALVVLLEVLMVYAGAIILRLLPKALLQVGDKVEIFTDGAYNRTATITGLTGDRLYIYGTLPLPLDYRGRFYGVGTDIDGVEFWYLAERKHYFLVPFAERVRKRYRQLSYPFNLCPVTSQEELLTAAQRQKEEVDNYQKENVTDSPGESQSDTGE